MERGRAIFTLVLIVGIVLVAWFGFIQPARYKADYQASIKTVQGAINGYGYHQRWYGFGPEYTEVNIKKEDSQEITLLLNKKIRSLQWYDSPPEGFEVFTISQESPWVYIDGTSEEDIYSITYAGTGRIKDLLEIKQVQSRIELVREFYFEEKLPDIDEKWIGDTIFDLDPDQDGKLEMTMKSIGHPKGYASGAAYYDLTGEKPVLKMVVLSLWVHVSGSCKVFLLKEDGEWEIGFTSHHYIRTEYNEEKNRFEFNVKMISIKDYKEQHDRMEKQSSEK